MEEDMVYGTGGGGELRQDLFTPEAPGTERSGVVFIHGGGWRGGTRRQFWRHAAHLAELGFVCTCIEHRLSGEAMFPAAVEDAKCAVRWMRSQAKARGMDPDRIGAVGGSSGGHLVAMLGTTAGVAELKGRGGHGGISSHVNAVVAFNGAFDLVSLATKWADEPDNPVRLFLGGTLEEKPEVHRFASPVFHVSGNEPSFLFQHGTADETVPFDQSEGFHLKLTDAAVYAELEAYEGASHGFFNKPPHFQPSLVRMAEFLVEHLGRRD